MNVTASFLGLNILLLNKYSMGQIRMKDCGFRTKRSSEKVVYGGINAVVLLVNQQTELKIQNFNSFNWHLRR